MFGCDGEDDTHCHSGIVMGLHPVDGAVGLVVTNGRGRSRRAHLEIHGLVGLCSGNNRILSFGNIIDSDLSSHAVFIIPSGHPEWLDLKSWMRCNKKL